MSSYLIAWVVSAIVYLMLFAPPERSSWLTALVAAALFSVVPLGSLYVVEYLRETSGE